MPLSKVNTVGLEGHSKDSSGCERNQKSHLVHYCSSTKEVNNRLTLKYQSLYRITFSQHSLGKRVEDCSKNKLY